MRKKRYFGVGFLGFFTILAVALGPWLQHLYTCFSTKEWGFLIAGAIFYPVGWIHGLGIWFGFW